MATFFSVLLALVVLGVIITVHEFGHFIVGKKSGIGVIEFAVGMGPKIFGWERNGTKYSLRAIPLGGYCSFVGEDEKSEDPRAMNNQPVWKRFLTVLSGPLFNFLLALITAVILIAGGFIINPYSSYTVPQLGLVEEGMPAYEAGLMVDDIITHADGEAISQDEEGVTRLQTIIASLEEGESVLLTIDRNGEAAEISLAPRYDAEYGKKMIGVAFYSGYETYDCNVITAIPEAFELMGRTVVETVVFLKDLVVRLFRGQGVEQGAVTGAVGIVSTMSTDLITGFSSRFSDGLYMIVYWFFVISLNLGIMNLLPLPALDGGRILFLIYEGIFRKPFPREKEAIIHLIGFGLLIVLMIVITVSDISNLIS
ncbi:MAG: site-2 protease family protein [Clostridia bacterium]|nr:site-2 protease family protein [Clostridia bacterium]